MIDISSEDIPQKEDISLLMKLPHMIEEGYDSAESVADQIGQARRHGNFVLHAGRVLGIVSKDGSQHKLTHRGRLLLVMNREDSRYFMRSLVLRCRVMRYLFDIARRRYSGVLDRESITEAFERDAKMTYSTAKRRASAMCAWLKWLSEFEVVKSLGGYGYEVSR